MNSTITTPQGVRIDVDASPSTLTWESPDGTLSALQGAVGGSVELVSLLPELDMWVDEEGILKGLPINPFASAIAHALGARQACYFGPAVFTGGVDDGGHTLPLTEAQLKTLTECAGRAQVLLRLADVP